MELNHLHTFYIVAKELGFSKAAKRLRVQQPAVSKAVSNLESHLGVRLFERTKRSVRLTADGKEIFEICGSVFEKVEKIDEYLSTKDKTLKGALKFGISDALAAYLLPETLKTFLKFHPLVRPSVFAGSSPSISGEILGGELEFGLFFTRPSNRFFEVKEIATIPFCLVGNPSFKTRKDRFNHFIASRENEYQGEHSFPVREMLAAKNITPEVVVSTNNLETQKRLIEQGLGVGLLPAFMVQAEIKKGRLALLLPYSSFSFTLKRVVKRGKTLSKIAEAFLNIFEDSFNHS